MKLIHNYYVFKNFLFNNSLIFFNRYHFFNEKVKALLVCYKVTIILKHIL